MKTSIIMAVLSLLMLAVAVEKPWRNDGPTERECIGTVATYEYCFGDLSCTPSHEEIQNVERCVTTYRSSYQLQQFFVGTEIFFKEAGAPPDLIIPPETVDF